MTTNIQSLERYDQLQDTFEKKSLGEVAAPREAINAFERPTLSKKHMPNSRGSRLDIPAWSVRPAGFGFKNIGGVIGAEEKGGA